MIPFQSSSSCKYWWVTEYAYVRQGSGDPGLHVEDAPQPLQRVGRGRAAPEFEAAAGLHPQLQTFPRGKINKCGIRYPHTHNSLPLVYSSYSFIIIHIVHISDLEYIIQTHCVPCSPYFTKFN